jgi:hypothetical protein
VSSRNLAIFGRWRHTPSVLAQQAGLSVTYIKHIQRYPWSNHLYWLAHGKPNGHADWGVLDSPSLYRQDRCARRLFDSLILFLYKMGVWRACATGSTKYSTFALNSSGSMRNGRPWRICRRALSLSEGFRCPSQTRSARPALIKCLVASDVLKSLPLDGSRTTVNVSIL